MKRTYEIEILGQKFIIRSAESKAHVDHIVQFVTNRLKSIQANTKTLSAHHTAILALLNMAEDVLQKQETLDGYREKVVRKARTILDLIDDKARPEA